MKDQKYFDVRYKFVIGFSLVQILFGFTQNSLIEIIEGLYKIVSLPSTLITDYIGLANMGAAFVNSGLVTLACIFLLIRIKQDLTGPIIAALFTITGFALFGKNLLNIWVILLGTYFYSKYKNEPFNKYIVPALFGTAMSPAISEIIFSNHFPLFISIPFAIVIGLLLGFIIAPLGASLINVHKGFNLYNIGFSAGMAGLVFVSIFRSFGYVPKTQLIWTSGNNQSLGIFLYSLFIIILGIGYFMNEKSIKNYPNILKHSGQLISDFMQLEGFGVSLINMGICGILATSYILLIDGQLNGPTISGIYTIAGFSLFGKHPRNILPIFLGVLIGSLLKVFYINDPGIQLAALFGTALAPIAGKYGWFWGTVAGFVHSSVVLNVGYLHGGLNLYNNGFAAGLSAAVLIPIIELIRSGRIPIDKSK